ICGGASPTRGASPAGLAPHFVLSVELIMSFIEIQGLKKNFGDFQAVSDLSLSIEKGEFVSLLGPSGCGKTTTLQMIAGFLQPSAGKVIVGSRDVTAIPPEKRGMGVVFQSYALFP